METLESNKNNPHKTRQLLLKTQAKNRRPVNTPTQLTTL
jgi:hypothetical protein